MADEEKELCDGWCDDNKGEIRVTITSEEGHEIFDEGFYCKSCLPDVRIKTVGEDKRPVLRMESSIFK